MTDTVSIPKSTFKVLVVAFVGVLLVASFLLGYSIGGTGKTTVTAQATGNQQQQQPTQPAQPGRVSVSTDDDPVQGDANAKVTIIEFSDFQCPFCERFYTQSLKQIEDNYVKTGKVKFVYRDFPLDSIHPNAVPAALAAGCANEQGKFWEYHNKLFENQGSLGDASYKQWAADLGLNTAQFNKCYDDKKYLTEVQKDFQDGATGGVSGTPSFFIGSDAKGYQLVVGAQPYSTIKQVIDAELAA